MVKCPNCNGTGKRFVPTNKNAITGNGYTADCLFCNGTGEIELTNEEWLHTLNTEQLAEAILQQWIHGAYHGVGEFGLTDKEIESSREDIVEWLKQPHTPKE